MKIQHAAEEWPLAAGDRVRIIRDTKNLVNPRAIYTVVECCTFTHGDCWYVDIVNKGTGVRRWVGAHFLGLVPPLELLAREAANPRSGPEDLALHLPLEEDLP